MSGAKAGMPVFGEHSEEEEKTLGRISFCIFFCHSRVCVCSIYEIKLKIQFIVQSGWTTKYCVTTGTGGMRHGVIDIFSKITKLNCI